jgi:hypothetical protein
MILLLKLLVDERREAGNVAGGSVFLQNPVGLALVQDVHGILQLLGRFFGGFGGKDGLDGRSNFVFFCGITRRACLGAADIFNRRLDDRHGSSKKLISSFLKRRHIVNEGEDSVNHGSITNL